MKLSFTRYIAERPATNDIRDDFTEDFRSKPGRGIRSEKTLLEYLRRNNACSEAIEAASLVWQEYELKLKAIGLTA